jgi:3-deoxy-manno-octulosonate cytidylyltransferase (CMP-KDO synthetase)
MKTVIVIPARYASTRFPGKPLVLLKNKPLVQWVWERARKSKLASRVVVATDDERIYRAVEFFGGEAVMTAVGHPSGTDRMAEVAQQVKADVYVNVQGDEPTLQAAEIDRLIRGLGKFPMATLAHGLESTEELTNPHVVKVVCGVQGQALYFTRAGIPHPRQPGIVAPLRHVGIYAFKAKALRQFVSWKPGPLERTESLEQLRALENGMPIRVILTKMRCLGVDTPEDLRHIERLL